MDAPSPDLLALVDSLTSGHATDLSNAFANFSTELLQQANALLAATATATSLDTDTSTTSNTDAINNFEDIEVAAALALSNSDIVVNRTLEMQCLRQQQLDERVSKDSGSQKLSDISRKTFFFFVLNMDF